MKPIVIECPSCGAVLPPRDAENHVTCEYCDIEFELEKAKSIRDEDGQELDPFELLRTLAAVQMEVVGDLLEDENVPLAQLGRFLLKVAFVGIMLGALFWSIADKAENWEKEVWEKEVSPGLEDGVAWPLRSGWGFRANLDGPVGRGEEASFVGLFEYMPGNKSEVVLISMRLSNLKENWRIPVEVTRDSWYLNSFVEIVDAEIYLMGADATIQRISRESGQRMKFQKLTDVVTNLCRHESGIVVVQKDEQHQLLDPKDWSFSPVSLPPGCEKSRSNEARKTENRDLRPKVPGLSFFRVHQEDDLAVAVGYKHPGTALPMAVGFRPSTAEILWTEPISGAPADQIEEQGSGMFNAEAVSGSVFYSFSKQMENKITLVARNAETGALLWEEALPPKTSTFAESIRVMGDFLILEVSQAVYVLETKTGKLTGRLGG
jgi:hypothetical protein